MAQQHTSSPGNILDIQNISAFKPLIGQIAHEFNNLITPLLAYPSIIRIDLPEKSHGRDLLSTIEKTAKDMSHIANQLLILSGKGLAIESETEENIGDLIDEAMSKIHLQQLVPAGIKIETFTPPSTPIKINCFKERILIALFNIIKNSIESITGPGSIQIILDTTDESYPKNSISASYARICISDSGSGMDQKVLNRLFHPLTTTKKERVSRGAGLGLSIAYLIVKDHDGQLICESTPSKGTEFSILIPLAGSLKSKLVSATSDSHTSIKRVEMSTNKTPRDKKKILLVDDEKAILKLFRMIIETSAPGCEIDTAENGAKALELFRTHHHGVILMDLHMPVMDGQQTFIEIERLCAQKEWEMPPVIFCTGFAPPDMISNIVTQSDTHCLLQKPVRSDILIDTIKKRLA